MKIALDSSIPVRFSNKTKKRLDAIRVKYGLTCSFIIRNAVENQLKEWERTGQVEILSKKTK
ncbi:MAG: hypothetical protein KGJ13_03480 [Patescibacteria group bacterium]|nr:hypothetical protein [Patescibacteria group bacterium]